MNDFARNHVIRGHTRQIQFKHSLVEKITGSQLFLYYYGIKETKSAVFLNGFFV